MRAALIPERVRTRERGGLDRRGTPIRATALRSFRIAGTIEATVRLEIVRGDRGATLVLLLGHVSRPHQVHSDPLEGAEEDRASWGLVPGAAWVHVPITWVYLTDSSSREKALLERIVPRTAGRSSPRSRIAAADRAGPTR